jgi:hypothetical protein
MASVWQFRVAPSSYIVFRDVLIHVLWDWFETTLNYRVIVERCMFPNGVGGGSTHVVKRSLYVTEEN